MTSEDKTKPVSRYANMLLLIDPFCKVDFFFWWLCERQYWKHCPFKVIILLKTAEAHYIINKKGPTLWKGSHLSFTCLSMGTLAPVYFMCLLYAILILHFYENNFHINLCIINNIVLLCHQSYESTQLYGILEWSPSIFAHSLFNQN